MIFQRYFKDSGITSTTQNSSLNRLALIGATGLYTGYIPKAPGTFGTVIAVPVYFCLSFLPLWLYLVFLALIIFMAVLLSGWAEKYFGQKDDPRIVIDEIAGYLVAMIAVGPTMSGVIIGFLLFRVFDILKPWPVGLIDKKISGGIGIVMDDAAAGIYAAVLTNILVRFVF